VPKKFKTLGARDPRPNSPMSGIIEHVHCNNNNNNNMQTKHNNYYNAAENIEYTI